MKSLGWLQMESINGLLLNREGEIQRAPLLGSL